MMNKFKKASKECIASYQKPYNKTITTSPTAYAENDAKELAQMISYN